MHDVRACARDVRLHVICESKEPPSRLRSYLDLYAALSCDLDKAPLVQSKKSNVNIVAPRLRPNQCRDDGLSTTPSIIRNQVAYADPAAARHGTRLDRRSLAPTRSFAAVQS